MTPSLFIIIGLILGFIGATIAVINFRSNFSLQSPEKFLIFNGLAALFWGGGVIAHFIGIIMFLINYAKS